MVIWYLSLWVRSFIFLIMDRLLKDNGRVVIMKDPYFLICGEWIMGIGHFSFPTSLLGCLYHLITWRGGFNSGLGSVYFSMGKISLWVELRYWVCSSNPFIRRTCGLTFWACAHIVLDPINCINLKLYSLMLS